MPPVDRSTEHAFWDLPPTEFPSEVLSTDLTADVCVIGAGISGLTTAYLLQKQGKKVVVLDRRHPGRGETLHTTAHITHAIDDRYYEMERLHGAEGARIAAESHTHAIDRIEKICKDEKIACDFERVPGYLYLAPGDSPDLLDKELEAAHRAGLTATQRVERVPIPGIAPTPALLFPNQAQFHPILYLQGLEKSFLRAGGKVFRDAVVTSVTGGEPSEVVTENKITVTAGAVVVATNSPINDRFIMHDKQAAYRTYAQAFSYNTSSLPRALYWDTQDPYHYIRFQNYQGETVLIVGGEDHRTGQEQDEDQRHQRLETWARSTFPKLGACRARWSGQVEETIDGLAFIGRNPLDHKNIFICTGDSGMGMTHGTIAGILTSDLILGRENAWEKLYTPSRKTLGAIRDWAEENINTGFQYRDYITPADVSNIDEIPNGSGAIVREGFKKVAVYRAADGKVHRLSAVCPHLGGLVRWNAEEQSWDCPCHGSRFSCTGEVLNGPTISGLAALE